MWNDQNEQRNEFVSATSSEHKKTNYTGACSIILMSTILHDRSEIRLTLVTTPSEFQTSEYWSVRE